MLPGGPFPDERCPLRFRESLSDRSQNFRAQTELHYHRHRTGSIVGNGQGHLNVHGDEGIGGIVHVTHELLRNHGDAGVVLSGDAGDFPIDAWRVLGDAAKDFMIEVLHDFRPPQSPPVFSGFYLLTILQSQRIRKVIGRNLGFIEVGGVGRPWIAVGTAPQSGDVEQIHDALMILFGCQMHRRGKRRDGRRRLAAHIEGAKHNRHK